MVKPLSFKGDKKLKKRKRGDDGDENGTEALSKANATASAQDQDDDDSWVNCDDVSELAGPVIFVLNSTPPSCIACDSFQGKVFRLDVENVVEGNRKSAEPHSVQMVWVPSKVAGTPHFSFKGHHGKFLSFDKFGIPSATAEAISPAESFGILPVPTEPGCFSLQTQRDTFVGLSDDEKGIRGDIDTTGFKTSLVIRMQARFKPKAKKEKEERGKDKISRLELEKAVGRRLDEDEIKRLKRARKDGSYHEALLDAKSKGKRKCSSMQDRRP